MLRGVEMFARLQQGFRRNAADVQAGAAQRGRIALFVDARIDADGFKTQLCGADGGNISARACADYGDIVLRHCSISFKNIVICVETWFSDGLFQVEAV